LRIATSHYADAIVATLAGRLDHQSAAQFEAALTPLLAQVGENRGALVLDFSDLDYISSVGLRALMIAARQTREQQSTLVVAELQSVVAEIFAISRFDRVLAIVPTLDDALDRCSAAAREQYRAAGSAPRP
jgi:anti-anti-sigma factor